MSEKFPRTYHLPWSPGDTSDDKKLSSVSELLNVPIVITEKLDGGNSCLTPENIFARSHNQTSTHPSFDLLKLTHATIKFQILEKEKIFGENCRVVHSITYTKLPTHFFVFHIKQENHWLSWDQVKMRSQELSLSTVPLLWEGTVSTEKELQVLTERLIQGESIFGGPREGLVVRVRRELSNEEFETHIGKWVRKGHVQTDKHWSKAPLVYQKINKI